VLGDERDERGEEVWYDEDGTEVRASATRVHRTIQVSTSVQAEAPGGLFAS